MGNDEVSEEFVEAFRSGIGSIRGKCEWCGRESFEDNEAAGNWTPGELEALRKKANKDLAYRVDSVSFGCIDGKKFVVGCPCLTTNVGKYERFIWAHRRQIFAYLQARLKTVVENALAEETAVEQTKDSFDQEQRVEEKVECRYCGRDVSKILLDEISQRCFRCSEEMRKLREMAAKEQDENRYEKMAEKILKLGGAVPVFSGDIPLPF